MNLLRRFDFDPDSLLAWQLLVGITLVGTGLFVAMGFRLHVDMWPCYAAAYLVVAAWLARGIGFGRLAGGMEVAGFTFLGTVACLILELAVTPLTGPWADESLAKADRLIGFDWPSVARAAEPWRFLLHPVYESLMWQSMATGPVLCAFGQQRRAWLTVAASLLTVIVATIIYPFVPAVAAAHHFGFNDTPLAIEAVREGLRDLDKRFAVGLITFPSVHAAQALIMAWAFWRTPIGWPMLALNIAMAASAIVVGEHYLVDIFAGLTLGAAAIYLARVLKPMRVPSWASRSRLQEQSKAAI